jgi:hypothetical protein
MENPMSKALPIVSALLAATTLWGQPEPVSVTVGQTVRLTVTARPPGSCAAQIGFLDNGGKPVGPSSHVSLQPGQSTTLDLPSTTVVKEAGQRVVIQPLIVADQGIAASACQSEMEVNEAKPSGGPSEGIKVHGHWTIDVRNPDGTLASHNDFENSLLPTGGAALSSSLARTGVIGSWKVTLLTTSAGVLGALSETSSNLTVGAPTSGPNSGNLVLNGSFTDVQGGIVAMVSSLFDSCSPGVLPASCIDANAVTETVFTSKTLSTPVTIVTGQLVQVTVVISFS